MTRTNRGDPKDLLVARDLVARVGLPTPEVLLRSEGAGGFSPRAHQSLPCQSKANVPLDGARGGSISSAAGASLGTRRPASVAAVSVFLGQTQTWVCLGLRERDGAIPAALRVFPGHITSSATRIPGVSRFLPPALGGEETQKLTRSERAG